MTVLHDLLLQEQNVLLSKVGAADVLTHPDDKGDAVEFPWREAIDEWLPDRYCVGKGTVIDSKSARSQQIDLLIYDRQYSPHIFPVDDANVIVPAESVYAAFEIKPRLSKDQIEYASDKVNSVRALYRTSVPIEHAGGTFPAKVLHHIVGGLLTVGSDWSPALGDSFEQALAEIADEERRLDIGCAIKHAGWTADYEDALTSSRSEPEGALMFFLVQLFERLRSIGTVPAMDLDAYTRSIEA